MTEQNLSLIGHEGAIRQVTEAFKAGRMAHAWLITGIAGIGKATLARHIACHVLSGGQIPIERIEARHPAVKLVLAEAHPDMLTVKRMENDKGDLRESIAIDDARKIAGFLHLTAAHNGWRVAIIDEAHTLTRNGQNAILKIVEEPPPRTLILMTATAPGMLLPTIRSRSRVLALDPLGEKEMMAILMRFAAELGSSELEYLIELSGGSAGFALKAIRAEALPVYEELLDVLGKLPDLDIARLHKLADRIGRKADAEGFEVVTALLVELLRRSARARATGEGNAEGLGKALPLGRALELWDGTRATLDLAERANLDKKLAFIKAVSDIRRAVA